MDQHMLQFGAPVHARTRTGARALIKPVTLKHTLLPERASHVAIVKKPYLDLILSGTKTIEARLTKVRQPPFGCVRAGDVVAFKQSSGPFRAVAYIGHVQTHEHLTPDGVSQLCHTHNDLICASDDYWNEKLNARYATLLWIDRVVPTDCGPTFLRTRGSRKAWFVLDNCAHTPAGRIGDALPSQDASTTERAPKRGLIRARRA